MLLYRVTLPAPLIITVPALVRTFSKITFPVMFMTPPLPMARGAPLKEPPDQLNDPVISTDFVKAIVPFVKLTVSLDPGTPTGAQLFAANQSREAERVQVKLAAEHQPALRKTGRHSRGSRM